MNFLRPDAGWLLPGEATPRRCLQLMNSSAIHTFRLRLLLTHVLRALYVRGGTSVRNGRGRDEATNMGGSMMMSSRGM